MLVSTVITAAALSLSLNAPAPPTDGPMSVAPTVLARGMASNCSTPKGDCGLESPVPPSSVCTCEINGETVSGEAQE